MDRTELVAEFRALSRGRGVRRTEVRSWLGPLLQEILGISPTTSDDDARNALVQLVREHTASFPRDLRYLFLVAVGVVVDQPFLEDRLAIAAQALERSPRVLRRRLRSAETMLACSLAEAHPSGAGPFTDQGWQWEEHDFELVLRSRATLTLNRTLRALADHQQFVHESFVIPKPLDPGIAPVFTAVAGVTVVAVERSAPNSWDVSLALPATLAAGQLLTTSLVVEIPDARVLSPFLALAPLRPCRQARVSVDFGTPPVAATAWVIDSALPSDVTSYRHPAALIDTRATPVVSAQFTAPRQGFAYGVGWTWAE